MNEHSASRHLDVLREEAPHLVDETAPAGRRVRDAAAALKQAIDNGRVEHEENGSLSEATWNLLDLLNDQLIERLGELEQAERRAGRR